MTVVKIIVTILLVLFALANLITSFNKSQEQGEAYQAVFFTIIGVAEIMFVLAIWGAFPCG